MADFVKKSSIKLKRGGNLISGSTAYDDNVYLNEPDYNKFNLSHAVKFTTNMGTITPVMCHEMLPADKYRIDIAAFTRLQPIVYPILDNVEQMVHMFSIPTRMCDKRFEQWYTGGTDGQYNCKRLRFTPRNCFGKEYSQDTATSPLSIIDCILTFWSNSSLPSSFPLTLGNNYVDKYCKIGSMFDYLNYGLDYEVDISTGVPKYNTPSMSMMLAPLVAYQRIYNDYYRNENYEVDQFLVPSKGVKYAIDSVFEQIKALYQSLSTGKSVDFASCLKIAKKQQGFIESMLTILSDPSQYASYVSLIDHDLSSDGAEFNIFSDSTATSPQDTCMYGDIDLSIASTIHNQDDDELQKEVKAWCCTVLCFLHMLMEKQTICYDRDYFTTSLPFTQRGNEVTMSSPLHQTFKNKPSTTTANSAYALNASNDSLIRIGSSSLASQPAYAQTTMADIRALSAGTRFLERNAKVGYRFLEYVLGQFGVSAERQTLDKPNYIGGLKSSVAVDTVMSTASTSEASLGEYGGSATSFGKSDGHVSVYTSENSYLFAFYIMKPKNSYVNTHDRMWEKYFDRTTIYTPDFAYLTEQPLAPFEVDASVSSANQDEYTGEKTLTSSPFGYAPRYAEYRFIPSTTHGELKSTLLAYSLGRYQKSQNAYAINSADFQHVDPTDENIERIFQVGSENADQLICEVDFGIDALRAMPKNPNATI